MNRLLNIPIAYVVKVSKRYKTVMSGIQPTGFPHIGNYFGAIQKWIDLQSNVEVNKIFLSIVDLHSMTPRLKTSNISENVYNMAASLIACGLSENKVSLFQQSLVPYHTYLAWILMCVCPISQVQSLPQWKEKQETWTKNESPNAALLMYPILQAADILLYNPNLVPVGEDQIIHLNIARYLRNKLISWHSEKSDELQTLIAVPQIIHCRFAKIQSLKDSGKKMSKSDANVDSRINLNDSPDEIRNKITKALTDSISNKITYDVEMRPALANLINIYCSIKKSTPKEAIIVIEHMSKVEFKELLAEELIKTFDPIRERIEYLLKNRDEIDRILLLGHNAAMEKASETMHLIENHIGLKHNLVDHVYKTNNVLK